MPVKRQLFFLVLLLCSGFASGQRIEFFREELVFTLDSCCFSVNGDYYFRNPSASTVNYTIFYPVSPTPGYKAIDTIVVYDVANPNHPLPVEIKDSVASFSLGFSPRSEKCVKIYYRQHHPGNRARYILLTTRQWKKPLDLARYSLITGNNIYISHFSIPPDKSEDFGNTKVSYWNRQFFMPDKDFVVDFLVNK